jgi:cytochrome P450
MTSSAEPDRAPRFPFERGCPFDPPAEYRLARERGPLARVELWNGERAWLVTRHEHVRAILADDGRFSGRFAQRGFPTVTEARVAVDRGERAFVGMDNPEHDRFRRLFTQEFSVPGLRALEPRIVALAGGLLDAMVNAGPPADLVADFAVTFPSLVMSVLMGSPFEDHRFIIDCAVARHGLTQTPGEARDKARELAAYVRRLIDAKEAEPGDDLITRILHAHVLPGRLGRDELAEIGAMLLRAGHDTTTNMIGLGTLLLLREPAQLERLRADPALARRAVEELLRHASPVQFSPRRVARVDVEIGGVTVRAGEGLFLLLASANRDEAVFTDPDAVRLERDAARHVAFGFGIHQCLGQTLARMELAVAFEAILRRLPGIALAQPEGSLRFKHEMQIFGVHALPVTWDAAAARGVAR